MTDHGDGAYLGFYLGIDATADVTTAALADGHGVVRAVSVTSGIAPHRQSSAEQQQVIRGCIDEVLERAGLGADEMTAVAIGLPGAESIGVQRRTQAWMSRAVAPARCLTECPAMLSLRAATRDAVGVGLMVDQRTTCVGRDRYGRRHTVGGHGAVSGDVGYAEDLAMRALGGAWMAEDGRVGPSSLSKVIPEALGVRSVHRLPELLEGGELSASVVSTAVDCLFAEADAGDGLAAKIIEDTGHRLGASAVATLRALSLRAANAVVVFDGRMLTRPEHRRLADAVRKRIINAVNEAHVTFAPTRRVLGAILFARDLMDHAPLAFADRVRGQARAIDAPAHHLA